MSGLSPKKMLLRVFCIFLIKKIAFIEINLLGLFYHPYNNIMLKYYHAQIKLPEMGIGDQENG